MFGWDQEPRISFIDGKPEQILTLILGLLDKYYRIEFDKLNKYKKVSKTKTPENNILLHTVLILINIIIFAWQFDDF